MVLRILAVLLLLGGIRYPSDCVVLATEPWVDVQIAVNGYYNISLSNVLWLENAPTRLFYNGAWYSQDPSEGEKKLALEQATADSGTDAFGAWQSTSWFWMADDLPLTTRIKTYPTTPGIVSNLIVFEQEFPKCASGTSLHDHNKPLSAFPAFWTKAGRGMFGKLGYLTFHGGMSAEILTGMYNPAFGGSESSQIALIDKELNTVILSPLDQFMVHVMSGEDDRLDAGVGGEFDPLPEGYLIRTILYASQGVKKTFMDWGSLLLQWHGKHPTSTEHDVFTSSLGYSTTGYYFYNPCDGEALKNCSNYEDTLLQVDEYRRKEKIPYKYYLIDSWWYGEDIYHGVNLWEDTPTLLKTRFPHGMKYLSEKLGLPFKCHLGKWATTTPYAQPSRRLDFLQAEDGVIPHGPAVWQYLFSKNKEWGLACIKQDHISEQVQMVAVHSNVTLATDWLAGQGDAAEKNGLTIQYCMTFPSVTLNSVTVAAATHQRLGADYLPEGAERNWNIGAQSLLVFSVGLLPFKDTFFSSSKEVPTSSRFEGYSEKAPELHAVVSILSAGPVAPSDGVNGSDVVLLRRLCREDGILLKPDVPGISVDATWLRRIFNDTKGPDGELWTTYTELVVGSDAYTWGYVFAANLKNSVELSPAELHLPSQTTGKSYEMGKANLSTFTSLLEVAATGTEYGTFRLIYTLPVLPGSWYLLGETEKFIPVSKNRITSIKMASGNKEAVITLTGSEDEKVQIFWLWKGEAKPSNATCTIGRTLSSTLTLPGGKCT